MNILSIEQLHWSGRSINKTQLSSITNFTVLQYITRQEKTVVSQILYFYGFLWSSNGPLSFLNAFNGFRIYIYIASGYRYATSIVWFCSIFSYFPFSSLLLLTLWSPPLDPTQFFTWLLVVHDRRVWRRRKLRKHETFYMFRKEKKIHSSCSLKTRNSCKFRGTRNNRSSSFVFFSTHTFIAITSNSSVSVVIMLEAWWLRNRSLISDLRSVGLPLTMRP